MPFRIALFGSYYYGLSMFNMLLSLQQTYPEILIVGVATDDPTQSWTNPKKRLWRYPHTHEEEVMVGNLAERHEVTVWRERVDVEAFQSKYTKCWKPDVCYMGVFGQKIPEDVWSYPSEGFYNFHPCTGTQWPCDPGCDPVIGMIATGVMQGSIAMHNVDSKFDHGDLVAFSDYFPIHPHDNTALAAKNSSSLVAELMAWHICEILGKPLPPQRPRVIAKEHTVMRSHF